VTLDGWSGPRAFDDVLVAARGGDEEAFAEIWRWLQPPLLRWLRVVAPGAVDDVASEVWFTVAKGLDAFVGGPQDFRGWVFLTARRRAIDTARRERRRPPVTTTDHEVADDADPAARLVEAEGVEEALTLLRRLTPEQAEVVALRVIGGFSVAETATLVGKSEGAVRILCHRGLRALAAHVGADAAAEGVTR
jgi:RNA polymerase sigma-70 factor, ECF subfamily